MGRGYIGNLLVQIIAPGGHDEVMGRDGLAHALAVERDAKARAVMGDFADGGGEPNHGSAVADLLVDWQFLDAKAEARA